MPYPNELAGTGSGDDSAMQRTNVDTSTIDRVLQSVPALWAALKLHDTLRLRASSRATRSAHDAVCSHLCCRARGKAFNAPDCRRSLKGIVDRGCRPLSVEFRLGGDLDDSLALEMIGICGASVTSLTIAFPRWTASTGGPTAPAAAAGSLPAPRLNGHAASQQGPPADGNGGSSGSGNLHRQDRQGAASSAGPDGAAAASSAWQGKDCAPLAAAVGPSVTPALRRLVLRCPSAAAVRLADELLAAAGTRLQEAELAVKWPHAWPYCGLSYCTALVGLRVLCPCPRGGGDSVERRGCEIPAMRPLGVPPAVAVLSALTQLRSLELHGIGWLPQLGVRDPGAQLSTLSSLTALTRLSLDLSFVLHSETFAPLPRPRAAAAATQSDGPLRAASARLRALRDTAAAGSAAAIGSGAPGGAPGTCCRVTTWPADEEWYMGPMLRGLRELRDLELRGMKIPFENLPAIAALAALTRLLVGSLSLTPLVDTSAVAAAGTDQGPPNAVGGGDGGDGDGLGDRRSGLATSTAAAEAAGLQQRQHWGLYGDVRPRTPLPLRLAELALERLPALPLLADLYDHPSAPRLVLLPGSEAAVSRVLWLPVVAGIGTIGTSPAPGWMPAAAGAAAALLARDVLPALCKAGEEDEAEESREDKEQEEEEVEEGKDEERGEAGRKGWRLGPRGRVEGGAVGSGRSRRRRCSAGGGGDPRDTDGGSGDADAAIRGASVRAGMYDSSSSSDSDSSSCDDSGSDGGRYVDESTGADGGGWWRKYERRLRRPCGQRLWEPRGGVELHLLGPEEWSGVVHGPHGPWMERLRPMDGYVRRVRLTGIVVDVAHLEGLRRGLPGVEAVSPGGAICHNLAGVAALHEEWPVLSDFLRADSEGWTDYEDGDEDVGFEDDMDEDGDEDDTDEYGADVMVIDVDNEGNVNFLEGPDGSGFCADRDGDTTDEDRSGGGDGVGDGVGIGVYVIQRSGRSGASRVGRRLRGMEEGMLADMREDARAARRAAKRAWGSDSEDIDDECDGEGEDEGEEQNGGCDGQGDEEGEGEEGKKAKSHDVSAAGHGRRRHCPGRAGGAAAGLASGGGGVGDVVDVGGASGGDGDMYGDVEICTAAEGGAGSGGDGDGGGHSGDEDLREAAADAEEVEVAEEMEGMQAALAAPPAAGEVDGRACVAAGDGDIDFRAGIADEPIKDDGGGVVGCGTDDAAAASGGGGPGGADVDSFFATSGGSCVDLVRHRG